MDPAAPRIARLRFEAGFEDPNWCTASHVIFVQTGTFTVALQGQTWTLEAGSFLHLRKGEPHRAQNLGPKAVELLVVSCLEELA